MGIFGDSIGGYHDFPFAYDTSMGDNEYKYGDIIVSSDFDGNVNFVAGFIEYGVLVINISSAVGVKINLTFFETICFV